MESNIQQSVKYVAEPAMRVNSTTLERTSGRARTTQAYNHKLERQQPQKQIKLQDGDLPPITSALPIAIRDVAYKAIDSLPNIYEKIKALRHLEDAAGIQIASCRWSDDIKKLKEQQKHLDAANLMDAALKTILDIPHKLQPGTLGEPLI